jgi:glutaredoxin
MNTYIVYGVTDCPACLHACADLMENDLQYVFVEMDFSKDYRTYIRDEHNWPTFPIIARRNNDTVIVIGGYEQLKEHLKKPECLI